MHLIHICLTSSFRFCFTDLIDFASIESNCAGYKIQAQLYVAIMSQIHYCKNVYILPLNRFMV